MKKNMEILNNFKNMEMFRCEICKREFKNLNGLTNHIGRLHKNDVTVEEYYLKFIGEKGKCVECGKDTGFRSLKGGYNRFCGLKCSNNSIEVQNKKKETCLKNSGYENPMKDPKNMEKSKQTYFEKTGYYHSMQNPESREKSKQTCLEKTGYENSMQVPKNKEKHKQTCLENFGYENPSYDPKNIEKIKQTNFEKTGYDYPMQNPVTREKSKVSNLRNSGYENTSQDPKSKEKKKETCLKNSGYDHQMKNPEIVKKQQEIILNNNNGVHPNKLTYKQVQEKYPDLVKIEGLIEGPNGEIWGHCKNANCKNSRENGGYFELTPYQINGRNRGIDINDTAHFYCCEECKHSCPLYWKSASALHNLIKNKNNLYTSGEYLTWRNEVFARQLRESPEHTINYCEYCGTTENLHAHHIRSQKLEPEFVLDPDNGLVVCKKCHYEKCHKKGTECSSGNLANKICK